MKTVTITDPTGQYEAITVRLESSALLLIDLDGNLVTTLKDRGPAATNVVSGVEGFDGQCARRVWAARLRYWADQFEQEEA